MRTPGKIPYHDKPDYIYEGLPVWKIPSANFIELVMVERLGEDEAVSAIRVQHPNERHLRDLYLSIQRGKLKYYGDLELINT